MLWLFVATARSMCHELVYSYYTPREV